MVTYEIPISVLRLIPDSKPPPPPPRGRFHERYDYLEYAEIEAGTQKEEEISEKSSKSCAICTRLVLVLLAVSGATYYYIFFPNECSTGFKYFPETGYCYKVVLTKSSFAEAKFSCESENAHLASIHSSTENEFLHQFYKDALLSHMRLRKTPEDMARLWIGLIKLDGEWKWTDGSKVTYTKWAVGEPNTEAKDEFWAEMVSREQTGWSTYGSEWNNIDSNRNQPYFCKKPSRAMNTEEQFTTMRAPTTQPT